MSRQLVLVLSLVALASPIGEAQIASSAGFMEDGGRLYHFEVVRDSVVILGEGVEGRPSVTLPYAAFVDVLGRAAQSGALVPDTLDGEARVPFDLRVDEGARLRFATSLPMGQFVLGLLGLGLFGLVAGAVVWERRARKARKLRSTFRRRLAAAREAERAHFARELHDGPVQDLCAVQLALGASDAGEPAREAVNGVVSELRALCDQLRPSSLDAFGLVAALSALADRAGWHTHNLDVRFRADDIVRQLDERLDNERQLALYRVGQEAINNAIEHAGASRIEVELRVEGRTLVLTVDDDGTGPPDESALALAERGHYGLLGMQERADLLKGRVALEP
ncbi:MAG: ATP-binding protein, partial [Bacteroidota bacterium]